MEYDTKLCMEMNEDGKIRQEMYGDIDKICYILEEAIYNLYKIIYFGTEVDDGNEAATSTIWAIIDNGVSRATKDIKDGCEPPVEFSED